MSKYPPRRTNCPIIYPPTLEIGGYSFSRELIEDLRCMEGIDIPNELFDYIDYNNRRNYRQKIETFIYEWD